MSTVTIVNRNNRVIIEVRLGTMEGRVRNSFNITFCNASRWKVRTGDIKDLLRSVVREALSYWAFDFEEISVWKIEKNRLLP